MCYAAWLLVVGLLAALLGCRVVLVRRLVRGAEPADAYVRRILDDCCAIVGVKAARVRLGMTDALASPAICGLVRPTILLPRDIAGRLDGEQLRLVFVHELLHWKRGDLHVHWLQSVLQALYFYNPAVWLAGFMLKRLREQAVDEAVLVALEGERSRYGITLLDIATVAPYPAESVLQLVGVVESRTARRRAHSPDRRAADSALGPGGPGFHSGNRGAGDRAVADGRRPQAARRGRTRPATGR